MIGVGIALIVLGVVFLFIVPWVGIPAGLLGLVLAFLVAHLALLPHTLEDLDSINFALGVRQFDVAKHQPHPPGYPLYTLLIRAAGLLPITPPFLRISLASAVCGAAAVWAVFRR